MAILGIIRIEDGAQSFRYETCQPRDLKACQRRAENQDRRDSDNEKTKDHPILLFPKVMGFSHLGGRAAVLYRTACPNLRLKLRHSV